MIANILSAIHRHNKVVVGIPTTGFSAVFFWADNGSATIGVAALAPVMSRRVNGSAASSD
jgi:hypothetical protein